MAPANPKSCPVCGSPDRACGAHAGTEPTPVDAGFDGPGTPTPVATVLADVVINGQRTTIRTTVDEAEAHGWPIVGVTAAGQARGVALHKARTVASAGTKAVAASKPDPTPLSSRDPVELYRLAQELDLRGRSKLKGDAAALAAALEAELEKSRQ